MKIALSMAHTEPPGRESHLKAVERDILATQKGDWNAKNNLARTFTPLLTSLAEKRSSDQATINRLVEAGKEGLLTAARKYKPSIGAERFQIFALDFIEKSMDSASHSGGGLGGFFRKLFGK